jgi:hypothetical protein
MAFIFRSSCVQKATRSGCDCENVVENKPPQPWTAAYLLAVVQFSVFPCPTVGNSRHVLGKDIIPNYCVMPSSRCIVFTEVPSA